MSVPVQYRQGDVFLEVAGSVPGGLTEVPRDNGRVVLAYGEVTGHAHAIVSDRVRMFRDDRPGGRGGFFLLVAEGEPAAELRHEEHDTIALRPGAYRVDLQREYSPDAIRRVAD